MDIYLTALISTIFLGRPLSHGSQARGSHQHLKVSVLTR